MSLILKDRYKHAADGRVQMNPLDRVFENAPAAMLLTDLDGTIRVVNRAATELLDRAPDTLLGKPLTALVAKKERSDFHSHLRKLRNLDGPAEWEQQLVRANGALFSASMQVSMLGGGRHEPGRLCWALRDVGAQKATAHTQAVSEFMISATRQIHASLDLQVLVPRIVQACVPDFADVCVLQLLEDQGQTNRIEVAHRDPDQEREIRASAPQWFDPNHQGEVTHSNGSGKRKLVPQVSDALQSDSVNADEHLAALHGLNLKSYISVPMQANGHPLGAMTFAITDSKRQYTTLDLEAAELFARHAAIAIQNARQYAQVQAELRRNEEAFAFSLKEISLPLKVASSSLQVLKKYTESLGPSDNGDGSAAFNGFNPKLYGENLRHIEQAIGKLLRMHSAIIDLGGLRSGAIKTVPEWSNLGRLVHDTVEAKRAELQAANATGQIEVQVRVPDSQQIRAEIDRSQIKRVLGELIDNAVKYSPPGGVVRVNLTVDEDPELQGELRAHVVVRDDGIGVPLAEQSRVFAPFFRGSNAVGRNISGIGAGLAISREIVIRHGGEIRIESEGTGQGSAVQVILPRVELTQE